MQIFTMTIHYMCGMQVSYKQTQGGKIPEEKMVPNFNNPGCNLFFPFIGR